jgi:hypothetical protein
MPDGLTSALSSLGSSPATKGALDIAQLGSTGYNLYNQYQNQQYQNNLRSYAQDPAKMNAYAAKFTQPLTAGLQTSVANNAQSYLASHGLSDSPQISEQVEAQAIAPYIQQNQQTGYSNALQALNLGGGAVNPNSAAASGVSGLAKVFSQLSSLPNGAAALKQLLQLSQSTPQPQTTSTDLGSSNYVPYVPQQNYDFNGGGGAGGDAGGNTGLDTNVYTPDYSADLGG